jgi:hypothetical protein
LENFRLWEGLLVRSKASKVTRNPRERVLSCSGIIFLVSLFWFLWYLVSFLLSFGCLTIKIDDTDLANHQNLFLLIEDEDCKEWLRVDRSNFDYAIPAGSYQARPYDGDQLIKVFNEALIITEGQNTIFTIGTKNNFTKSTANSAKRY